MDIFKRLKLYIKKYYFVLIPILIYILLRVPSFFESFWYGDEGIYAAVAKGLHEGKILYSQIWDNKPPLLYLIYYIGGFLGWPEGLVFVRFLSMISGLVTIYLLSKLVKDFTSKTGLQLFLLTFTSVLIGSSLLEGNTANAEMFFIAFNVAGLYLLSRNKSPFLVGFLAFLSFFIKTPGFVEAGLVILGFLIITFKEERKLPVLKATKIFLGFFPPLLVYLIVCYFQGNLGDFISTVFLQNARYAGELNPYVVVLGFEYEPNTAKTIILFLTLAITSIAYLKNEIDKKVLILTFVFSAELYAAMLSGRNYTHYLFLVVPGVILIGAYLLDHLEQKSLYNNFKFVGMFFLLLQFTLVTFTRGEPITRYINPVTYYPDFIRKVTTGKSQGVTYAEEGNDIDTIIKLSAYINNNFSSYTNFYAYTDQSWIFPLIKRPYTNKFTVSYHINYNNPAYYPQEKANKDRAELIIIDDNTPEIDDFFDKKANLEKVGEFRNFKVYKNLAVSGKNPKS